MGKPYDSYERFRLIHGGRTNHETARYFIRRAKAGRLQVAIDRYIPINGQARANLLGPKRDRSPLAPYPTCRRSSTSHSNCWTVPLSGFRQWLETQVRGHSHQASQRVCLHLSHHLAPMRLHRDLGDAELAADLLIQLARDHERHDLPFAAGQQSVAGPERLYL